MTTHNILVLGSGGREHVFIWKLAQSATKPNLYAAPGNAGTAQLATNVDLSPLDFEAVAAFCLEKGIDTIIPGNEDPLVAGIVDYFHSREDLAHIFVFGPVAELAQMEGSKDFAKEFMMENRIPTAGYHTFTADQVSEAISYVENRPGPYVLKADGLAAGKGVLITEDVNEAKQLIREMLLERKFGEASEKLVIEDFIIGVEFSVFAISDGESYAILPMAKDYKRIGEGDSGLNTGGMGAVSPVPFVTDAIMQQVQENIVEPTFEGFIERGEPYVGFLFFGLIKEHKGPMVIEYNVRMGDPETEVVFPRIKNDMVQLLEAMRNQKLHDVPIEVADGFCTTVFTVSGGYPESYEKQKEIQLGQPENGVFFHAGTKQSDGQLVTSGGRVIAATAWGSELSSALKQSYNNVSKITFDGMYYRSDIGQDLIRLQHGDMA
ncbi:MAG: phosphoribosylamine--glycine ligase [Flavobacteriales bacterium]|nr:phosphoribosylamine--glycine ligase [Bacteroidota bacterium]MCB9239717.1 phosphoribosylamine--glycine ligase [Flavobacteriales bacterium]